LSRSPRYRQGSTELVPDAVASLGKAPFDIEMRASDSAGATFQAPLIRDTDTILIQLVYVGGADIKAGLIGAFFDAHLVIDEAQVRLFIHAKTVEKELVFDLGSHLTALQPSHSSLKSFMRDIFFRTLLQMAPCFCFLVTPLTVSISRAAWLASSGSVVNNSLCS